MDWLLYLPLTIGFYVASLVNLKSKTANDRIRSTPIFWIAVIFFVIFEFSFAATIRGNILWHSLGLGSSILYALSIYFYLKSLKKNVEGIFYELINQSQGKVSVLSFMQYTQLPQKEAESFLRNKLRIHKGMRYETRGNIYYEYYNW